MSITTKDLMDNISTIKRDPSRALDYIIDAIEANYLGEYEVLDTLSPWLNGMQASVALAANAIRESESNDRAMYPENAQTEDELYRHMSDDDYIGRFATPTNTNFAIILNKAEVINLSVQDNGYRKLVIPRNTFIDADGVIFSMQYPIEIRIMNHGGINIIFNNDKPSPLYSLSSNYVDWKVINYNEIREDYLYIVIPCYQFKISSYKVSLNASTRYKKTYSFDDKFYHVRAYMATGTNNWTEIKTTHSDQVFDIQTPTLLLKKIGNTLTVELPPIYYSTGLVNTELRIDIYQTKGFLELPLTNYQIDSFILTYMDVDLNELDAFSAPLKRITSLSIIPLANVSGGRNELSFSDLRQQVLNNVLGNNNVLNTDLKIEDALSKDSFSSVKYIDNETDRVFLATRSLPVPTAQTTLSSTSAGLTIEHLVLTLNELASFNSIIDNGDRFTIKSNTLFSLIDGVFEIVDDSELASILAMNVVNLTQMVNSFKYLYNPFHYIVDNTDGVTLLRAYHLDIPTITSRYFINENDQLGSGILLNKHELEQTETGYALYILIEGDEVFNGYNDLDVFVQLKIVDKNNIAYYLNGELLAKSDGNRVYEFTLNTNYDIDDTHHICLKDVYSEDINLNDIFISLESDITVSVIYDAKNNNIPTTELDTQIRYIYTPTTARVLYQERITVKLGEHLDKLWARSRTLINEKTYLRYTENVILTFDEDIYDRATTGASDFNVVDGKIQFKKIISKGDPLLDSDGNVQYRHKEGDLVLVDGEPQVLSDRGKQVSLDIMVIDGLYYFTNNELDIEYKDSFVPTILSWLASLDIISQNMQEETELRLYPKTTTGIVKAYVGGRRTINIDAEQRLSIKVYVTKSVFNDASIREIIRSTLKSTLISYLDRSQITYIELTDTLYSNIADVAISVSITGLGGDNYEIITLDDEKARLSLGKKLSYTTDNTTKIVDDLNIEFELYRND